MDPDALPPDMLPPRELPTDEPTLDDLTLDELQHRAFTKAREAHDVGFFWDLAKHLRGARAMAAEDGSAGGVTGSVTEAVEVVRELLGNRPLTDVGEDEPLLRAKLVDYLRD